MSTETVRLLRGGEQGGKGYGVRWRGGLCTCHYTVTTRMTSALRWAAIRAILMFHNCGGQSHKTVSTDHNFWSERRAEADSNQGPSAYQPNALPLGQTSSHPRFNINQIYSSQENGRIKVFTLYIWPGSLTVTTRYRLLFCQHHPKTTLSQKQRKKERKIM